MTPAILMALFAPSLAVPVTHAVAIGTPASWVTSDDYPQAALRAAMEGTVGMTFDVNAEGYVKGCAVTLSSGYPLLDHTACGLIEQNGRYTPARDRKGNAVPGGQKTLRFTWRLPQDGEASGAFRPSQLPPPEPFSIVVAFDVTADGTVEDCKTLFRGGLPNEVDLCGMSPAGGFKPYRDARGQALRRRVTLRSSVSVEEALAPETPPARATPPERPPERKRGSRHRLPAVELTLRPLAPISHGIRRGGSGAS